MIMPERMVGCCPTLLWPNLRASRRSELAAIEFQKRLSKVLVILNW